MKNDWSSVSHYLCPQSRCVWSLTQRFKTHNTDYDNFLVYPWVTPGSQYRPDNEMRKIRFVVAIFRAGPHWGHQIIITFTTLSFESQQNSRREWIFTNNYWSCEQIFFWLCFLQVLNTQLFSWNWNMQIMDVDSNFLQCSIIGWYWQSVLRAGIV